MKVSVLVKGCNPIITVIQLDVRLTLQFFGLKKTLSQDYHETCKDTFYEQMCLHVRTRRKKKHGVIIRTASSFLALNYPTRPLILNLMLKL